MRIVLAAFLASIATTAAAQTSAPAAPAPSVTPAQPAQNPPGRPLILRLDEVDGPRINVGPSATEKPPEKDLPALGGPPTKTWERPSDRVFPIDSERANQLK